MTYITELKRKVCPIKLFDDESKMSIRVVKDMQPVIFLDTVKLPVYVYSSTWFSHQLKITAANRPLFVADDWSIYPVMSISTNQHLDILCSKPFVSLCYDFKAFWPQVEKNHYNVTIKWDHRLNKLSLSKFLVDWHICRLKRDPNLLLQ